ncbi:MAG: hypothetical protein P4L50_07275 [Anaerolineaceae bacterium]|nr:hypothetical protein [Anaerolineaceae bacterium]
MFRFGILWRILMVLVLAALLVGAGTALYRAGLAQGYQAGILAAGKTGTSPVAPQQLPYYGYGYPPFGFYPHFGYPGIFPIFGPIIGIGFFLLIFFLIGGLFRFAFRRHWGGRGDWSYGYGPGPWGQGPHGWGYGPEGKGQANPQSEKPQGPPQSA